jgi:3-hydroxyacyl-CoA dehydrogenase
VVLNKEITGFLLNRIQGAVLNEALNLYENGYATAASTTGLEGRASACAGPSTGPETIDLNAPEGVLDYARRYGHTYAT